MYITVLSMRFYTIWITPRGGSIAAHTIHNWFSLRSSQLALIKLEYEIIHQTISWLSSLFSIFSWLRLSRRSNAIPTVEPKLQISTQPISVLFCGITMENPSPWRNDSCGGTSRHWGIRRHFSRWRLPYQAKVRKQSKIGCIYVRQAMESVRSPYW